MLTLRRVDRIVAQCVVERMAAPDRQLEEYWHFPSEVADSSADAGNNRDLIFSPFQLRWNKRAGAQFALIHGKARW